MNNILRSAAKIVFLLVAFTACIALFRGLLDSKDFMTLAMLAFSFYFGSQNLDGDSSTAGGSGK